jgi:hypothetical protein
VIFQYRTEYYKDGFNEKADFIYCHDDISDSASIRFTTKMMCTIKRSDNFGVEMKFIRREFRVNINLR